MIDQPPNKDKRPITSDEHHRLITSIKSWRWRCFLKLLWETGADQDDVVCFRIEHLRGDLLEYNRFKTNERVVILLPAYIQDILNRAACGRDTGWFMPMIKNMDSSDRESFFLNECLKLGIHGLTLNSYRHAWAERVFNNVMKELD
jgi:integrase